MAEPRPDSHVEARPRPADTFLRFSVDQRIEHAVLLVSFTVLAVTGLPQMFADAPLSQWALALMGGVEAARVIHRVAAVVLMVESIFHILAVAYRLVVRRLPPTIIPTLEDFQHVLQDVLFYLGRRARQAYYGRYSYAEKAEYLAVVWGTLIMVITGFMMWNPIASARLLPGEFIPAAKAAHGGEAVLAVLSILLWHFYHVHLKHFNKSMFTGRLTRHEMEHEHPAELAQIESSRRPADPPPEAIRRRQRIFFPVALLLAVVLGVGLYQFVTFEQTAIATVPRAETALVYVPLTPTPQPPTPTAAPGSGNAWIGGWEGVFRNRCGTCHGVTKVGGLTLETYRDALQGGKGGPAIVPGNPEASVLVQVQREGGHPGQLTDEELKQVVQWIQAGAPEQ